MYHTRSAPVICNLSFLLLGYRGGDDVFTTDLPFSKKSVYSNKHTFANSSCQTCQVYCKSWKCVHLCWIDSSCILNYSTKGRFWKWVSFFFVGNSAGFHKLRNFIIRPKFDPFVFKCSCPMVQCILLVYILTVLKYRGADKSLARPGRKPARNHVRDARDFNNTETRAVIKFFFPTRQGAEGNSRHSDRNISLFPSWSG